MKYLPLVFLVLGLCLADQCGAKTYRTPLDVSYECSREIAGMKQGDQVETVLHLVPLADLNRVVIYLIPAGVEAATVDDVYKFEDLKTGKPIDVKLKVRLVKPSGSLAINYTTTTAFGTETGALEICCFGKQPD